MEYRKEQRQYDLLARDWWEWILELLGDPCLADHIEWDARRMSKWTDGRWMQFVNEPCTGERWYDAQVRLYIITVSLSLQDDLVAFRVNCTIKMARS